MQDAAGLLGISRAAASILLKGSGIPSRLVIGDDGRARRLVSRTDVAALLEQRRKDAEEQTGKGRPIKVPKAKGA